MYRFPIPQWRNTYETADQSACCSIPYTMLVSSEDPMDSTSSSMVSSVRVILPIAAAQQSRFIQNAMDGLRGLPGAERALLATQLQSTPEMGGGGGIRTQWSPLNQVETSASRFYKKYVQKYVMRQDSETSSIQMPLLSSDDTDDDAFTEAVRNMDSLEHEEAVYGQTVDGRIYPPALGVSSPVVVAGTEDDDTPYTAFCSNALPNLPTFPLPFIDSKTLCLIAHIMLKRKYFSVLKLQGNFDSMEALRVGNELSPWGFCPCPPDRSKGADQIVKFITASTNLQI